MREGLGLLNLGNLHYRWKAQGEARNAFLAALDCFEAVGASQHRASAQNGLGLVFRDEGRWDEALEQFRATADQRRRDQARDSLARAVNNIGEVLLFQGNVLDAMVAFHEALAGLEVRPYLVDVHINFGLAHQCAGDLLAALESFRVAETIALETSRQDALADVHLRQAIVLLDMGEREAAREHLVAAARRIEGVREQLDTESMKQGVSGRWQQVYEMLVLMAADDGRVHEAFEWSERARARALAEALARAPHDSKSGGMPSASTRHLLTEVATADEVRAALSDGAVMLSFFTTGVLTQAPPFVMRMAADHPLRGVLAARPQTLVFVISRGELRVTVCPVDPNSLVSSSPRGLPLSRLLRPIVLQRLYTALLEEAIQRTCPRRIYLVAHGPLHGLPFGAFCDSANRPLIRPGGATVTQPPSATVLVRHCLRPFSGPPPEIKCVAIGHDGPPGPYRLRHPEEEARFVAEITGGTALTGTNARTEIVFEPSQRCRWLHFASHARFDADDPLGSFLLLGANERLTARQVIGTWRLTADVVVLSACETGVARVLAGDEAIGLAQAFIRAGARSAVVTLWPVADAPTFELMRRFYEVLERQTDADPASALHEAQLWLQSQDIDASMISLGWVRDFVPAVVEQQNGIEHWAGFMLIGA